MSQLDPLFTPLDLGHVTYETEKAKGGVGLVQFGGATAVSIENSFHYGQINGAVDRVIPQYRRMAKSIHAHGGLPDVGQFAGQEFATTIWDVLSGQAEPGQSVLIHDESGGHAPLSCAQFLAARGSRVEIATPDKVLGLEMPDTNYGAHMTELYKAGVTITPDTRLVQVSRSGNRLAAELANTAIHALRASSIRSSAIMA